jgi:hypothetical protein
MLWCTFLVGLPIGSYAADFSLKDFPVTKWEKMIEKDMYKYSLYDQCLMVADHDALILKIEERVRHEECNEVQDLYKKGLCKNDLIPDGVLFKKLTGHYKGKPSVFLNKQKALGRTDQAIVCKIANGKKFAFFEIGKDKDEKAIGRCFNFGELPSEVVESFQPPVAKTKACITVNTVDVSDNTMETFSSGYQTIDNCGGVVGFVPGAMSKTGSRVVTEGQYEKCD